MSLYDDEALTRAYRFAQSCAMTEHARGRGDEERQWLDVLALLDLARHPEPAVTYSERDMTEMIEDRDRCMEWADKLAYTIAPVSVIGEHSSANDPWENALEVAEYAQLQVQAPVGDSPEVKENGASDGERTFADSESLSMALNEHFWDASDSGILAVQDCNGHPWLVYGSEDGDEYAHTVCYDDLTVEPTLLDGLEYPVTVLAAGYRKPTLPSVKDLKRVIAESLHTSFCGCDDDGQECDYDPWGHAADAATAVVDLLKRGA